MTKPHRYFEDLEVGEKHASPSRHVSEAEITDFATRYDPQYFHTNPEAAKDHPQFGQVVASGIHILAIWRQLDHLITGDIHWICGIKWDDLRWNHPMRADEHVHAVAELISKRESASKPERGVVVYRYSLVNQDGIELFYCTSTNLVERDPTQAAKTQ